jgi:hypothetical protein
MWFDSWWLWSVWLTVDLNSSMVVCPDEVVEVNRERLD